MIDLKDIYSLTDFQRKTKTHLKRLKKTGKPEALTVNGRAEVVVQDAEAYQKLMAKLDMADAVLGIQRGLDSMAQGKGQPAREALDELRRKHKIPTNMD